MNISGGEDHHHSISWNSLASNIKNSISQVFVEEAIYDYKLPYRPPSTRTVRGSSFIVAIIDNEIYLLTNAHVVENALNIQLRFPITGKNDIPCELLAFCPSKDIALLKISAEHSIQLLSKVKPLTFADSALVLQGDKVIAAGYPLGEENIQFTSGDVSGFHSSDDDDERDEGEKDRLLAYIQITAPINPGNSGGPALNMKGEVIGINAAGFMLAQNIGYAIPTRTIFAILNKIIQIAINKDGIMVYQPTLGFSWNTGSLELCQKNSCVPIDGIYVKSVYPTSSLTRDRHYEDDLCQRLIKIKDHLHNEYNQNMLSTQVNNALGQLISSYCPNRVIDLGLSTNYLLEGDIISEIHFANIYTSFDVVQLFGQGGQLICNNQQPIICKIDNYGQATVTGDPKITRILDLQEVIDMIPADLIFKVIVIRRTADDKAYRVELTANYQSLEVANWMIRKIYPRFEPSRLDYVIFAGMVVAQLADQFYSTESSLKSGSKRYGRYLVVTTVYTSTSMDRLHAIYKGNILTHINGERVTTIRELRALLRKAKTRPVLELRFMDKTMVALNLKKVLEEDSELIEKYSIPANNQLQEWLN